MTDHDTHDVPGDDAADDRQLRGALRSSGFPSESAEDRLAALRPRYERARRRRTTAVALSSAAAVALLVVGAAVIGRGDEQSVDVAGDPRPPATTATTDPEPRPAEVTTTVVDASGTTPVTVAPAGPDQQTGGSGPAPSSTTTPARGPVPGSAGGSATAGGTAPAPAPAPVERTTVTAPGGSIVVEHTATAVRLVSVTPAPGWSEESREESDGGRKVEVRFVRAAGSEGPGSGESRAAADVEGGFLRTMVE